MDNTTISNLFNDVYNVFWLQHRDHVPDHHSDGWDSIIQEGRKIIKKYGNSQLACDMVGALIAELDARMRERERNG